MLADAKSKSSNEIDQLEKIEREFARRDRVIGDLLKRVNQIEINQARQQRIIDEAVAASEGAVR